MNQNKINWPNWVALVGVAWLASSFGQVAPVMQAQGGLTIEQWLQSLVPLIAFIPKIVDSWKRDKDVTAKAMVALGAVQVARDFLGTDNARVNESVLVLRTAIVAKLEPPAVNAVKVEAPHA